MWEPGPFPKAALKRVQRLDGNGVCMDCGQPETSWGGPTYGILLCVKCAGRHRSLGTHLTVIKSLTMDRWDAGQVRRMELGGNGQLRAWFKKCQTENSALEMKYRTKAATLYRDNLRAAAEDDLASGAAAGMGGAGSGAEETAMSPERAPVSGKGGKGKGRIFAAAERAAASDLAREIAEAEAAMRKQKRGGKGSRSTSSTSRRRREDEHGGGKAGETPPVLRQIPSSPPANTTGAAGACSSMEERARRCGKDEEYEVVFGPGSMGFTLMKDAVSRALVTRLAPGGMAYRLGVRTGDYLVGVDGARLHDYDQLMLLLPRASRPLRLLFEGAGAALAASPPSAQSPVAGRHRKNGSRAVGDGDNSDFGSSSSSSSSASSSSSSKSRSTGSSSSSSSASSSTGGGTGNGAGVKAAERERSQQGKNGSRGSVSPVPVLQQTAAVADPAVPPQSPPTRSERPDGNGGAEPIKGRPLGFVNKGNGPADNGRVAAAADAKARDDPATAAAAAAKKQGAGVDRPAAPPERQDDLAADISGPEAAARVTRKDETETPRSDTEKEGGVVGRPLKSGNGGGSSTAAAMTVAAGEEEGEVGAMRTASGAAVENALTTSEGSRVAPQRARAEEGQQGEDAGVAEAGSGAASSSSRKSKKIGKSSEGRREKGVTSPSTANAESGLSAGSKVTVQDNKKDSKSRKGLLRRQHGDGSWTVRYSGGMEERRVAASRIRLRGAGEGVVSAPVSAPAAAVVTPTAAVAGTAGPGSSPRRGSTPSGAARGEQEDRRRSRKIKKGKEKMSAAASAEAIGRSEQRAAHHAKGGLTKKQPALGSVAWAAVDTAQARQEDFRAPGELRDDFFRDSEGSGSDDSSEAGGSALAAYARLDSAAAAAVVPRAFAPAAAASAVAVPTYAAGYAAPRRMEGFGSGSGSGVPGAVRDAGPGSRSTGWSAQPPAQPRAHTVVFPQGEMGLTLTKELDGGCSVTKVVPGGVAHSRGVVLGQRVCAVNGQPSGTYEQAMAIIGGSSRPLSITFVVPTNGGSGGRIFGVGGGSPLVQQSWADLGLAATIGVMDAANAVAVEWGLGANTPGVLDEVQSSARSIPPPPQGFRVHQKHSLMAIPTGVAGGFGNSLARHRTFAVDVSPDMPTMSTKKALSNAPGAEAGEFDVCFVEGELGMRLEERGSFKASSVVVRVTEDGQAMSLGVREGCTVVGINGEKYLSHAHTVATLKHAKRPVAVRFRSPETGAARGGRR